MFISFTEQEVIDLMATAARRLLKKQDCGDVVEVRMVDEEEKFISIDRIEVDFAKEEDD